MKPIIFSTPMVQAILDGRKTQTRRVIKDKDITNWFDIDVDGKPIAYIDQETGDSYPPTHRAKYQPGDILWVRETWQHLRIKKPHRAIPIDFNFIKYIYKADGEIANSDGTPFKWRPSIFMPRKAARIFLRVKEVSVERLIDISDSDVVNEGFQTKNDFFALWDKLNYHRGFGVANNPFVWKIEFERAIRQNGGQD